MPPPPVPVADILKAGFAPINHPNTKYVEKLNFRVVVLVHISELVCPFDGSGPEEKDYAWIEWVQWGEHLKKTDATEGRYGAIWYPFRCINDLHLFMRNWGYHYPNAEQAAFVERLWTDFNEEPMPIVLDSG